LWPSRPSPPSPPAQRTPPSFSFSASRWQVGPGGQGRPQPPAAGQPPPPINAAGHYQPSPARPSFKPRLKAAVKLPPSFPLINRSLPLLNLSPLNSNQGRDHWWPWSSGSRLPSLPVPI
jgi:hypothetical protein